MFIWPVYGSHFFVSVTIRIGKSKPSKINSNSSIYLLKPTICIAIHVHTFEIWFPIYILKDLLPQIVLNQN